MLAQGQTHNNNTLLKKKKNPLSSKKVNFLKQPDLPEYCEIYGNTFFFHVVFPEQALNSL